jgi:hypothetical protein
LRSTPVDAAHLFARANVEPASAKQVTERQARFTGAKILRQAGFDAIFASSEVGEAERTATNVETARLARKRQATCGARLLKTARDERHVAARRSGGVDEAISELTASMQANGQVAGLKLEPLYSYVGFDEAKAERAHYTRTLIAALAATTEQCGVAIEGECLALKEL